MKGTKRTAMRAAAVLLACGVGMTATAADGQMTKTVTGLDVVTGVVPIATVAPVTGETLAIDLPTAVQLAVNQNYAIHIAEHKARAAAATVSEVAASKNPSLDFQFGGSKFKTRTEIVQITDPRTGKIVDYPVKIDHGYHNSLSVTWPIWTGGRAERGIDAARDARDIAAWEVVKQEADVKYRTTAAYYQLVEALNLRDIADTAVENLHAHVDNVQAHFDAGVVAKLDVLSSQVALANAQEKQIAAANGAALAQANLNHLMRLPQTTTLRADKSDLPQRELALSLDQAVAYALDHRWELMQAELGVSAAEAQLAGAKAGHLPTVGVKAEMSWQDKDFPGFKNENWTVTGAVSWPLFDGGATAAKTAGAKAHLEEARETLAQAREGIRLDVTKAYLDAQSARQRIATHTRIVEQAQEAFAIARVRYRAGVGINLDVLDAQLQLDQARTNYVTALFDYNVGLARLEQAMGVPAVVRETQPRTARE